MKRIIACLMMVAMLCGIFTGCGDSESESSSVEGGSLKVGVPQKITITDYDNNAFTRYVEESLGIDIEFVFFSSTASEYQQQLALMAASGEELPDVMIGFYGLGTNLTNSYGQEGYFKDLTKLIDKHGKSFKAQYNKLSDELKAFVDQKMTDPDTGAIYGMPYVTMDTVDDVQSITYINKNWLAAVGMEAPTTVDELYEVLKAFKTKDPNGNGKQDEVPMLGANKIMDYVINAYIYFEEAHPYNVEEDGLVYAPFITDEYREALKMLHKMCDEGLYPDLSFTATNATELKNIYTPTTGTATVGIIQGHPSINTNTASELLDQYTALGPLSDETGKGGYLVVSDDNVFLSAFITDDCENPDLAMKFIDFFYEDETVTRSRRGEKDVDWKVEPGVDITGVEVPNATINGQAFFQGAQTWGQMLCGILTAENFSVSMNAEDLGEARAAKLLAESHQIMINAPLKEHTVRNFEYTMEEFGIKERYEGTINSYIKEQAQLFIVGDMDINSDADWNAYLKQIEELQLDKVLEVKQTAYDRVYGQ